MEKAIEIKRRAQRCILSGDLDGALSAYEKLIATGDSDPYHSVLLADLLFKKGDHEGASKRYLEAVGGYEKMALYKNAIAVCKKMSRLSLAPEMVLQRLASLHALDGLATESSLYYMQHAEVLLQRRELARAIESLRRAFQVCPDNVKALERMGEAQAESGASEEAANILLEAASHYERLGQVVDAKRCQGRARELMPGIAVPLVTDPPPATESPDALESPPALETAVEERSEAQKSTVASASGDRTKDPGVAPRATPVEAAPGASDELVIERNTYSSASGWNPSSGPTASVPTTPVLGASAPSFEASSAEPDPTPDGLLAAAPEAGLAERNGDDSSTPARPGIGFDWQAAEAAGAAGIPGLPEVSVLLEEAQVLFQSGEREAASASLVRAAQAYDRLGRFDSAAAIYRSLSKAAEAPLQLMLLWLKNCQRRDDREEAASVACDLGDRAMMDGDGPGAREWFERARAYDQNNELAAQSLERLTNLSASPVATETAAVPAAPAAAAPVQTPARVETPAPVEDAAAASPQPVAVAPASQRVVVARRSRPAPSDPGLIEVSVDEAEPMVFDLGNLISEFRRGLEDQLASDPQGHYDLGMSYCEMGLHDEAIASFDLAAHAPNLRVRATEMIARCMLDRGDFDAAAQHFQAAIEMPETNPDAQPDLMFQLGLALEAGGRMDQALDCFERIYSEQPNYPDVAQKIRALRKALEKD